MGRLLQFPGSGLSSYKNIVLYSSWDDAFWQSKSKFADTDMFLTRKSGGSLACTKGEPILVPQKED
jgi:hypothetical protein